MKIQLLPLSTLWVRIICFLQLQSAPLDSELVFASPGGGGESAFSGRMCETRTIVKVLSVYLAVTVWRQWGPAVNYNSKHFRNRVGRKKYILKLCAQYKSRYTVMGSFHQLIKKYWHPIVCQAELWRHRSDTQTTEELNSDNQHLFLNPLETRGPGANHTLKSDRWGRLTWMEAAGDTTWTEDLPAWQCWWAMEAECGPARESDGLTPGARRGRHTFMGLPEESCQGLRVRNREKSPVGSDGERKVALMKYAHRVFQNYSPRAGKDFTWAWGMEVGVGGGQWPHYRPSSLPVSPTEGAGMLNTTLSRSHVRNTSPQTDQIPIGSL